MFQIRTRVASLSHASCNGGKSDKPKTVAEDLSTTCGFGIFDSSTSKVYIDSTNALMNVYTFLTCIYLSISTSVFRNRRWRLREVQYTQHWHLQRVVTDGHHHQVMCYDVRLQEHSSRGADVVCRARRQIQEHHGMRL